MNPILIYIAGPFRGETAWRIAENVHEAEKVGFMVASIGYMPVIPHSMTGSFHGTVTDSFWLAGTLQLMTRCDGVLMMEKWRESEGANLEHFRAKEIGLPVRYSIKELLDNHVVAEEPFPFPGAGKEQQKCCGET